MNHQEQTEVLDTFANDSVAKLKVYQLSMQLWGLFWKDREVLMKDGRIRELARQLTRGVDSIPFNIEEGYGRGFGKEYFRFLKILRSSARESQGRYLRCKFYSIWK